MHLWKQAIKKCFVLIKTSGCTLYNMYNKGRIPSLNIKKLPWARRFSFLFIKTKTFWTISWCAKHKKQGSHAWSQFQVTRPLESCCFWLRPIDSFSKLNDLSPLRNCLLNPLKHGWFFCFFLSIWRQAYKKVAVQRRGGA